MPIFIRKLRIENCEITVDVWQNDARRRKATLSYEFKVGGKSIKRKRVVMLGNVAKPKQIPPTPKTSKLPKVVATLTSGSEKKSTTKRLRFCK